MTTAFIAGATGYTGRAVAEILAARGVRTIGHVRPDSPRLDHWREHFAALGAEIDATPFELEAMRETLARLAPDSLFALLGTTRARARASGNPNETHEAIDYGLTSLLIRAAADLPSPPRFVYLSSLGASPRRGAYLRARWNVETELTHSGLPYVIARPSFITGPDRDETRPGERAAAAFTNGLAATLGAFGARRTRGRLRSLTASELAAALVAAASDPTYRGATLDAHELRALGTPGTRTHHPTT
jgi:nucleoside-diphosphate-sugar epimerase